MKRLSVLILMFFAMTLHAQKNNFWQKVNNLLTVVKNIDTTYIYHSKLGISLGIFSTIQQAGFSMKEEYEISDGNLMFTVASQYQIKEELRAKIGLEIGYGKLCIGYGVEIGPKRTFKKQKFAFNILGKAWGIHLSYFNIDNPFQSSLTLGKEGEDGYVNYTVKPKEPATLKKFSIDGYYTFNNKKFFYPATYKASLIQRRTAGSWMVTVCYMQGSVYNSPDVSYDTYNLLDCFATVQISLGGGYSGNIVCWHKDPKNAKDKGLRNLTLNITALPGLTAFNYLKTTSYRYNENKEHIGQKVSKKICYPMPNFIGTAALGMTLDRFFLSAQFSFNWFFFLSSSAYNIEKENIPDIMDNISFRGSLHDWNLKILFSYKF